MARDSGDSRVVAGSLCSPASWRCTPLSMCANSLLGVWTSRRHGIMVDVGNLSVGVGCHGWLVRRSSRVSGVAVSFRTSLGRPSLLHAMREHSIEPIHAALARITDGHKQCTQLDEHCLAGVVVAVQEGRSNAKTKLDCFRPQYEREVTDWWVFAYFISRHAKLIFLSICRLNGTRWLQAHSLQLFSGNTWTVWGRTAGIGLDADCKLFGCLLAHDHGNLL